jgi:hypothetical protein
VAAPASALEASSSELQAAKPRTATAERKRCLLKFM